MDSDRTRTTRRQYLRTVAGTGMAVTAGMEIGTIHGKNDGKFILDDFEEGVLSSAWQKPDKNAPAGRAAFTIQSDTAPEGNYALVGKNDEFNNDSSEIIRSDFEIKESGSEIQLYARLGSLLTGWEQANRIILQNEGGEKLLKIDQKDRENDPNTGREYPEGDIWSEDLETVQRIRIGDIDFDNNQFGYIMIDGERYGSNIDFISESSSIQSMRIAQGHFRNSHDVLVDSISFQCPSGDCLNSDTSISSDAETPTPTDTPTETEDPTETSRPTDSPTGRTTETTSTTPTENPVDRSLETQQGQNEQLSPQNTSNDDTGGIPVLNRFTDSSESLGLGAGLLGLLGDSGYMAYRRFGDNSDEPENEIQYD